MRLLSIFVVIVTAETNQGSQAIPRSLTRQVRAFNHPAYSMLSMYPGLSMGMGPSNINSGCIREDIVCPAYCLMEDEWGCKSCPCGPANGMSPAIKQNHRPTQQPSEEHECLGTILCMLTCKDGYRLGPRRNNGCQSCECTKKNDTNSDQQKQQDCKGPTCSTKKDSAHVYTDTSRNQTDDKSECEWPLCMNGQKPNTGPGAKSGLSSLPKGGSSSGEGGSVPGIDCIGPECSAKNGHHVIDNSNSAQGGTEYAMSSENGIGNEMSAHNVVGNEISSGNSMGNTLSAHNGLENTMSANNGLENTMSAHNGLENTMSANNAMGNSIAAQSVMANVKTSGNGAPVIPGIDCLGPECSTKNGMRTIDQLPAAERPLTPPSAIPLITCPSKETCARGCEGITRLGPLGYDGCPICECIITRIPTTPDTRTYVVQPEPIEKTCLELDGCVRYCRYGYTLGKPRDRQGCPSCRCILPQTPPPPTTTTTQKANIIGLLRACQDVVYCMKTCTSGYTLTSFPLEECPVCVCNKEPGLGLTCDEPLSCPYGCTVGYKCDYTGCPTCNCVKPAETLFMGDVHTALIESALKCGPMVACVDRCGFGYKTGNDGCPTCTCLQPATVRTDTQQLIPTPATTPSGLDLLSTPSPGQCVAILHCVMTCTEGYDVGEYGSDGCPSCTCLD